MKRSKKSIIVVSNGTGSMQHKLGHCVDSFDEVVRFNTAVISDEYAPFIGSKTTIWSRSDWTEIADPSRHARAEIEFADCKKIMAVPNLPSKQGVKAPEGTEMIPLAVEREARFEVNPQQGCWLTTGIITLYWLLEKYELVHALGWYCNNETFQSHYFEAPNTSPCISHDPEAERRWFKNQVQRGRVVEITPENAMSYKEIKLMRAISPSRSGIIHFHKSMRMELPEGEGGFYSMKVGETLELKWDSGASEKLYWSAVGKFWRNEKGDFHLKEV